MDINIAIEDSNLFIPRINNALQRENIQTIEDLLNLEKKDVRKIRCIGKDSYYEIIRIMHELGFLFKDERWQDKSLKENIFNLSIEEVGFSSSTIQFLKDRNGIYTVFDLLQIQPSFLALESLNGYHLLGKTVKREIHEKIKSILQHIDSTYFSLLKSFIEKEIGPIAKLEKPITSLLPEDISFIIMTTSSIRTVRELLQLTNDYSSFQRFHDYNHKPNLYISTCMYEKIVSIVHKEGYLFADERVRARLLQNLSKEEILNLSLSSIMISARDIRFLKCEGIHTVGDLCDLSISSFIPNAKNLYSIRGMTTHSNIASKIHELGLSFYGEDVKERKIVSTEESTSILDKINMHKMLLEHYELLLKKYHDLKEEERKVNEELKEVLSQLSQIEKVDKVYGKRGKS